MDTRPPLRRYRRSVELASRHWATLLSPTIHDRVSSGRWAWTAAQANAGSAQAHVLSCSRLAAGVGRRTHEALRALRIGVSTLCNPLAENLIRTQTHATLAELLELLRPFRATWVSASMLFGPCTTIAFRLIKVYRATHSFDSHASSSSVYLPLDHVGLSTFRVGNQTSGKATEEEAKVVGGLLVLQLDICSRTSPITLK